MNAETDPVAATPRIEEYAMLGDCRSAALVSREGAIDWLCFPRFDGGACFAALLGNRENGTWLLNPVEASDSERRYRTDTMVLETTHQTAGGTVVVHDALVPLKGENRLLRVVEGVSGQVTMRTELLVRFDYGSIVPWARRTDGVLQFVGGPDALTLRADIDLHGAGYSTVGEFTIGEGERVSFDLAWHESHLDQPLAADAHEMLDETENWWRQWASGISYTGAYRDDVRRSLIVLKALTYYPTGAIVAAPTTSLPEWIGGQRNWDYRYCWLRDATFTLLALLEAGCTGEAAQWRDWLIRAIAGDPADVRIMYGIGGERRLPEATIDWLGGFAGSTPVRIGNDAADQLQLDVYGEVMDAMHQARRHGLEPDDNAWEIQRGMLDWLCENWTRPDDGIWEVRGQRAHFVYSKVMAWVAFDRGIQAVDEIGLRGDVERWRVERERVHDEVCREGTDDRGVFTQAYGSSALDASTLMIPLVGFLPADDPRVIATVEAVESELTVNGLVRRYDPAQAADGVGGEEGTFLLCSFWLVDCLALIGRTDDAHRLYERLLGLRNDVGLLSEQYDPAAGRQLGNFPQAFSHIALASSAITLCPSYTGPSQQRQAAGSK